MLNLSFLAVLEFFGCTCIIMHVRIRICLPDRAYSDYNHIHFVLMEHLYWMHNWELTNCV